MARYHLLATALMAAIGGSFVHNTAAAGQDPPTAVPVQACGPYADLRSLLAEQFDEEPTSSGLTEDGTLMQLFASDAADTWTMVNVTPDGSACVLAVGRHWQDMMSLVRNNPA